MFIKPGALWTSECSLLALVYVPCLLAQCPPYSTLLGLCLPIRPFAYAKSPKKREFRRLMVCLVTKGTNVQVSSEPPCVQNCEFVGTEIMSPDSHRFYQAVAELRSLSEYHFPCRSGFQYRSISRNFAQLCEYHKSAAILPTEIRQI
jgi:hypothetical protein